MGQGMAEHRPVTHAMILLDCVNVARGAQCSRNVCR
jgi:hypothetical protein